MQTVACARSSVVVTATAMNRDGAPPLRRPSFAPPRRVQQPRSGFPEPVDAAATMSPSMLDTVTFRKSNSFWDTQGSDNVKDFATLQSMMDEIQQNIALRQDTISLLTGEVSRLQGQMDTAKGGMSAMAASAAALPAALSPNGRTVPPPPPPAPGAAGAQRAATQAASFPQPSFSAGLPSIFADDAKKNAGLYGLSVAAVVFAAGVVAPVLEDKMGMGGPAYYDFIASRGLPVQMAEVDPIIASHAGGVVGIMTAQLMNGGSQRRR